MSNLDHYEIMKQYNQIIKIEERARSQRKQRQFTRLPEMSQLESTDAVAEIEKAPGNPDSSVERTIMSADSN